MSSPVFVMTDGRTVAGAGPSAPGAGLHRSRFRLLARLVFLNRSSSLSSGAERVRGGRFAPGPCCPGTVTPQSKPRRARHSSASLSPGVQLLADGLDQLFQASRCQDSDRLLVEALAVGLARRQVGWS